MNEQNNVGDTPLHIACKLRHNNIVEALMLAGADETIANDEGKTPAQLAERKGGDRELLKLFDRVNLW